MPIGGYDDYTSLFHEAGHAEHFGSVDPSLELEYRYLGDSSATEGFAFLFEYLIHDKNWLATHIHIDHLDEYLDFAYLNKLFFLRRYGAKLFQQPIRVSCWSHGHRESGLIPKYTH
jgi:hypothetical protein